MGNPQILDGHGIRLRPWRPDDVEAVEAVRFDPIVGRWSGLRDENAKAWIERQRDRPDGVSLAVTAPPDQTALGKVALGHCEPEAGRAELSFWLIPHARRQGLAVAACRTLCEWGFASMRLSGILLDIEIDNEASKAVAKRLGASAIHAAPHVEIDRAGVPRRLITYLLSKNSLGMR